MEFLKRGAIDFLTTFLWFFLSFSALALPILPPAVLLNAALTSAFELLYLLLGGGCYNPSTTDAFNIAGRTAEKPLLLPLTFPLQDAAAVAALHSAIHLFPGINITAPSFSVSAPVAVLAEAASAFLTTLALLVPVEGFSGRILRNILLAALLSASLAPLTGAVGNPLTAFAWARVHDRLNGWSCDDLVYLCAPHLGAVAAALAYRRLATPTWTYIRDRLDDQKYDLLYRSVPYLVALAAVLAGYPLAAPFWAYARDRFDVRYGLHFVAVAAGLASLHFHRTLFAALGLTTRRRRGRRELVPRRRGRNSLYAAFRGFLKWAVALLGRDTPLRGAAIREAEPPVATRPDIRRRR